MQPLPDDLDQAIEFLEKNAYSKPAGLLRMFKAFQGVSDGLQLNPDPALREAQMKTGELLNALEASRKPLSPEKRPTPMNCGKCGHNPCVDPDGS